MYKKINHVALVVKDIEETMAFYQMVFNLPPAPVKEIPDQGVKGALVPAWNTQIEFIQPITPDTGVARFLEKRGEGLHHVCFEVDNIVEELARLEAKGFRLIDKTPRRGLAGMIAFIHPSSTKGVLIELAQPV